jgi:hypothetical protein
VGTITAAQGSIVFTAGTGKTIGIDGTYGPFTCTNLSPRSVVLVTFASATAAVYTAQAQVNLAGTQFTVKFRNTAAIGFALNDQMNFVILRK